MSRFFSHNQRFALISAAIYLSAGQLGFFVTGSHDFPLPTHEHLLLIGVSPLHDIVYMTLGFEWLIVTVNDRLARTGNLALGTWLLAAFLLGSFGGASELDDYLHLFWGLASIGVALHGRQVVAAEGTQK